LNKGCFPIGYYSEGLFSIGFGRRQLHQQEKRIDDMQIKDYNFYLKFKTFIS